MAFKAGDKVRKDIIVNGVSEVSSTTYTLIEHEGALHAMADHLDADPSPYPYDPVTGNEVGNPLAAWGISSRILPLEEA